MALRILKRELDATNRIIVVGDLHGDADSLARLLAHFDPVSEGSLTTMFSVPACAQNLFVCCQLIFSTGFSSEI